MLQWCKKNCFILARLLYLAEQLELRRKSEDRRGFLSSAFIFILLVAKSESWQLCIADDTSWISSSVVQKFYKFSKVITEGKIMSCWTGLWFLVLTCPAAFSSSPTAGDWASSFLQPWCWLYSSIDCRCFVKKKKKVLQVKSNKMKQLCVLLYCARACFAHCLKCSADFTRTTC